MSYVHGFSLIPSVSSLIPSFSIGNLFGGKSLLGGAFTEYWNKIKYCVMSSKISYSCVIPNIRFFIYTQLTGFPIPFIGPTLSTINMAYLGVNYLPFVLRDVICIVKSVALGLYSFSNSFELRLLEDHFNLNPNPFYIIYRCPHTIYSIASDPWSAKLAAFFWYSKDSFPYLFESNTWR